MVRSALMPLKRLRADEWKPQADVIEREHEEQGFKGRFGAGLPRINDGSLLFIMHMISKMKPEGSRLAIVFNGSPLFTGDAGSGESDIRRWIIESDWLEAIVALPTEMFYNTGIATYVWIVTNRKRKDRRGKIQLSNAVDLFVKMRKSLGNKRNQLSNANIERPLRLAFQVTPERIALLKEEGAFQRLVTSKKKGKEGQREIEEGQALQQGIVSMLEGLAGAQVDLNRPGFEKRLAKATERTGITPRRYRRPF